MASFRELKRDFGWKYALKEAWDYLKWTWPNIPDWIFTMVDESE